jgi:prepilin-type N-terminal cleavage/methylation domain-containing protein
MNVGQPVHSTLGTLLGGEGLVRLSVATVTTLVLIHFASERVKPTAAQSGEDAVCHRPLKQTGFSLLELMIVLSIAFIAAAMATMSMQRAARSVRLFEAGSDYANLLQNARIQAVKDDRFYTVRTTLSSTAPPQAYVDIGGTGTYTAPDPVMVFPQGVTPMPFASGPGLANLEAMFLPSGGNALATLNTAAAGPTFGSRGLPCTPTAGTCSSMIPTSYITFIQNQESGDWMAITVTPAGRVRQWQYDNAGNWSPRN